MGFSAMRIIKPFLFALALALGAAIVTDAQVFYTLKVCADSGFTQCHTVPAVASDTITLNAAAQTLTNKTLTTPIIATISNTGTVTLPTATDTLVARATTDTLTNKTIDAEGTGNLITLSHKIWMPAAICQNVTPISAWSLPTTNSAVAACDTGTNTQKGTLEFADGANALSAQITFALPADWTGAIDLRLKWFDSTATTGAVVWQVASICVADAETSDPAFNAASTVTDTAKGTINQDNDAAITGLTTTGCAAGETLYLKVTRDPAHVSDTMADTAKLRGIEITYRRTI